ncbi:hypothetical protein DNTS_021373 [Danionella cerebrum]|uniref:Uncharacterized protein n=1 Tax=Danionella cerebrum TaxID=2873325 RepID=A0A553N0A2_9TELE|nr:hypothetical protein DNTS_021373 [Danionella translucida]
MRETAYSIGHWSSESGVCRRARRERLTSSGQETSGARGDSPSHSLKTVWLGFLELQQRVSVRCGAFLGFKSKYHEALPVSGDQNPAQELRFTEESCQSGLSDRGCSCVLEVVRASQHLGPPLQSLIKEQPLVPQLRYKKASEGNTSAHSHSDSSNARGCKKPLRGLDTFFNHLRCERWVESRDSISQLLRRLHCLTLGLGSVDRMLDKARFFAPSLNQPCGFSRQGRAVAIAVHTHLDPQQTQDHPSYCRDEHEEISAEQKRVCARAGVIHTLRLMGEVLSVCDGELSYNEEKLGKGTPAVHYHRESSAPMAVPCLNEFLTVTGRGMGSLATSNLDEKQPNCGKQLINWHEVGLINGWSATPATACKPLRPQQKLDVKMNNNAAHVETVVMHLINKWHFMNVGVMLRGPFLLCVRCVQSKIQIQATAFLSSGVLDSLSRLIQLPVVSVQSSVVVDGYSKTCVPV